MTTEQEVHSRRVPALDGVRGLAILMVLGIHFLYAKIFPQPPPSIYSITHVLQFGWMGVDLFFVLSGFLITGILVDTKPSSNFFRSFYVRRILRIFPLYYLVMFTALVTLPIQRRVAWLAPAIPDQTSWISFLLYFDNWWMPITGIFSTGYLGLFWSLAVEEQVYLFIPLLVFWLKPKSLVRVFVALCFVVLLLRLCIELKMPGSSFDFMSTIPRMDSLLWGGLGALVVRSADVWNRYQSKLPYIALFCTASVLVIDFPLHDFYSRGFYTQSIGFTLIAIGFTALLLLVYSSSLRAGYLDRTFQFSPLRSIGRYSYGMYVLHPYVLILFARVFSNRGQRYSLITASAIYFLFNATCFLVAVLSFHGYEKHFLRLKKHFEPTTGKPALLRQI